MKKLFSLFMGFVAASMLIGGIILAFSGVKKGWMFILLFVLFYFAPRLVKWDSGSQPSAPGIFDFPQCLNCGEDVGVYDMICDACGAALPRVSCVCENCGGVMWPSSRMCIYCGSDALRLCYNGPQWENWQWIGTPYSKKPPRFPYENKASRESRKISYCPQCGGQKLKIKDRLICKSCGFDAHLEGWHK